MIIGYRRVSTDQQGTEGFGLAAQLDTLERAASARGWTLDRVYDDVASGTSEDRPGLKLAIDTVHATGGVLMVARLDRLSRSVGHFATLMDRAQRERWAIVCLDPAVDLTTPYGRAMAGMAAVFAQLERELIGQRTREGLEAARAAGKRIGRPPLMSPELEAELYRRLVIEDGSPAAVARELGLSRGTVSGFKSIRKRRGR